MLQVDVWQNDLKSDELDEENLTKCDFKMADKGLPTQKIQTWRCAS
jgi:hypothetical protein